MSPTSFSLSLSFGYESARFEFQQRRSVMFREKEREQSIIAFHWRELIATRISYVRNVSGPLVMAAGWLMSCDACAHRASGIAHTFDILS